MNNSRYNPPSREPAPPLSKAQPVSTGPTISQEKRSDLVAPPPVWTRYLDSRLKQFVAR